MTPTRSLSRSRLVVLVILLTGLAAALVITLGNAGVTPRAQRPTSLGLRSGAAAFLDRYETSQGQVIRRDQGGDTVSEGQAYAMLLSASIGDQQRFMLAWNWTRTHLQLPDGLLAYHYQGGRVVGSEPATDADLDAAHALVLGARRFRDPALLAQGRRMARAILSTETFQSSIGPVLAAGPWAVGPRIVNPSYFSPAAFQALSGATGDPRWRELEQTSYVIVDELTSVGRLPPDWAVLSRSAQPMPATSPGGAAPMFSYDAVRVPIRMAGSHTRYGVGMAARLWRSFGPGSPALRASAISVFGDVMSPGAAPEVLCAAAASAAAASQPAAALGLLDRAVALARRTPTYYGWALVAFTELMLEHRGTPGPM